MTTSADSVRNHSAFDSADKSIPLSNAPRDVICALRKAPFSPYAHYERRLGQAPVEWHGTSILAAMNRDDATHIVDVRVGNSFGFAAWSTAEWETGHLGMSVARLDAFQCSDPRDMECLTRLVEQLDEEWRKQEIAYVFTRLNTANIVGILALEQHGFITVDNLLTFSFAAHEPQYDSPISNVEMSPATFDDIPDLRRIAERSFRFDRFHNDPLIPQTTADAMHAEWIENQVCNGLADHTIVARDKGRPRGFLTCKIDRDAEKRLGVLIGTIWLVAVDNSARGKNIGRAMSMAGMAWLQSQGVEYIDVSTQSINIPASRTYLGAGFKYASCSTTLRLYLEYGEKCHGQ